MEIIKSKSCLNGSENIGIVIMEDQQITNNSYLLANNYVCYISYDSQNYYINRYESCNSNDGRFNSYSL
jgi:hypothetical protein